MLKNYLKIALRNILKQKGYSIINIVGLAVGIASCILILLWVQDELSFDRYHKNADHIYRIIQEIHLDRNVNWAITQGPLGPALKEDIPEIINYTRGGISRFRFKYKNQGYDEIVDLIDPEVFEMFDLHLEKGKTETALSNPRSIVLSKEMALKYFGNEEPIGKVINGNDKFDFVVSGVLADIPKNSKIRPDFILPFVFGREIRYTVDQWGNSQFVTFIMLKKEASVEDVKKKIAHFLDDKPTLEKGTVLKIQPLTQIHLYSNFDFDRYGDGDIRYIQIFSIAAFFILLIACINFMNLTTAKSASRSKEIGLRKVVGAKRIGLIGQFFAESLFFAFLALIVAVLLVELFLPVFNDLSGKEITFGIFSDFQTLTWVLGITILTGIVSGSYPALILSSFRPIKILKQKSESGNSKSVFRKILVVFQFSLSLIMIVGTLVVYDQLEYIRDKKLGYDKSNVMIVRMRKDIIQQYDVLKANLLQNPNILGVTRSSTIPTFGRTFSNSKWRWEGLNPKEEVLMHGNFIDYDFFETLAMKIKEGRGFSKEYSTNQSCVVLNEEAVKRMGVTSPVGMELRNGSRKYTIIGVVENYHFQSLHDAIEPLVTIFSPENCLVLYVRLKSQDISSTISYFEKTWKQFSGDDQFNFWFLDERLDNLYKVEQRVGTLLKYFALLTIFISCLGLFGLALYMAERRTKEIGIRKALGASIFRIVFMLSKEFTALVLLANIIAWPVAYYALSKWLQSYAYHTGISLWVFIIAGVLCLIIAWMTIAYQSIKAALINPGDTLKYE